MLAGARWQDSGLVFTNTLDGACEPSNVLKRCKRLLIAAGLPAIRFHDQRHSCASLLLAQRVPMRVVMEILGHTRMSTTADLYSHVMPAAHAEVADLMESVLAALR